jgi:NADH:ubiquinone oxidoreductase 24 kD subunit
MITISVCIGSACHLKGSYNVISGLQQLIDENSLSDKVEIKATFCLGNCAEAVAVRVNGESIENVSSGTVGEFFARRILPMAMSG